MRITTAILYGLAVTGFAVTAGKTKIDDFAAANITAEYLQGYQSQALYAAIAVGSAVVLYFVL